MFCLVNDAFRSFAQRSSILLGSAWAFCGASRRAASPENRRTKKATRLRRFSSLKGCGQTPPNLSKNWRTWNYALIAKHLDTFLKL